MKLNNRGWSFHEMLIIMIILIACLLLAVFYVYRLYSQLETSDLQTEKNYEQYEIDLKDAAKYYVENIFNGELSSSFIITIDDLKNEELLTQYSDYDCNGYVKIAKYNDTYDYDSYLSCGDYQTKNYSKSYE